MPDLVLLADIDANREVQVGFDTANHVLNLVQRLSDIGHQEIAERADRQYGNDDHRDGQRLALCRAVQRLLTKDVGMLAVEFHMIAQGLAQAGAECRALLDDHVARAFLVVLLGERNDTIKHECPVLRHQIDIGLQHFPVFRVGDQRAVFFQEIVDLGGRFLESGFKGVERGRVGIDQMGIDQYPQFHVSLARLTQRLDTGQAIFLDLLDAIGLLVGDEKPDGSDQQQRND